MKKNITKIIGVALFMSMTIMSFTGCVEHRYYHEHNYHTRGYYDRHHQAYPAGVNFDIHN